METHPATAAPAPSAPVAAVPAVESRATRPAKPAKAHKAAPTEKNTATSKKKSTPQAKPLKAKTPVKSPAKALVTKTSPTKLAKPAVAPAPAKTAAPKKPVVVKAKIEKPVKPKKPKLVRDSFTIPKTEYVVLEALKQRAVQLAQPVKKSELLRAGIKALAAMSDADLRTALKAVPAIKTGRPAADKAV